MSDLRQVVVVADGIGYKIPGQPKPAPKETYLTGFASRGDDVELDEAEYQRLRALGAVTDAGSDAAQLAKAQPFRMGNPANAVRIGGESAPLPEDKMLAEARRLGLIQPEQAPEADGGGEPEAPEVPADFDASDKAQIEKLSVPQLTVYAKAHGIETKGRKPALVDRIVAHAAAAKKS